MPAAAPPLPPPTRRKACSTDPSVAWLIGRFVGPVSTAARRVGGRTLCRAPWLRLRGGPGGCALARCWGEPCCVHCREEHALLLLAELAGGAHAGDEAADAGQGHSEGDHVVRVGAELPENEVLVLVAELVESGGVSAFGARRFLPRSQRKQRGGAGALGRGCGRGVCVRVRVRVRVCVCVCVCAYVCV